MNKLYEYEDSYNRITEILNVNECGKGIYISVRRGEAVGSSCRIPYGIEVEEHSTSIVIPITEVEPLLQSLAPTAYGKDAVLIGLNAHHLKVLIYSLELALDTHDGEIDQASQPYDLLEVLNTELNSLIERDQIKKDV